MHEHAFHFAVAGRVDAQRAAADGFAPAPRDEEADVGRAQRVDVEDVVAFRRVERLEIGVERGEEPHHVVLARAFEPDGGHRSASPGYHGRSFRPDAGVFDMRSRKPCFFSCTLLSARRKTESDAKVRQDLDILVDAVESRRRTTALEHRLLIPYFDLPRHIFEGLKAVLDARNGESRRKSALQRLRRYAGIEAGSQPLAELARARASERFGTAKLVWPYEGQVRQNLDNSERYIAGIAELFRSSTLRDWEAAHARLAAQLRNYTEWVKTTVLPRARKEHTLPRELYADRLKTTGIDLEPEQAISMGTFAFTEIRDEAARLAGRVARERNLASADYRDVIAS